MQELRRHEDFLLSHILLRLTPRTVMLCLKAVTISPGIEYYTVLRVPTCELWFQLIVETTLVAVAPEYD